METVQNEIASLGYDLEGFYTEQEFQKVMDDLVSINGPKRRIDRDLTEQAWEGTDKNESNQAELNELLMAMDEKDRIKYLIGRKKQLHSIIIPSSMESEAHSKTNSDQNGNIHSVDSKLQPENEDADNRKSANRSVSQSKGGETCFEKPLLVQQQSQNQQMEGHLSEQQPFTVQKARNQNESVSRPLNASDLASLESSSSVKATALRQSRGKAQRHSATPSLKEELLSEGERAEAQEERSHMLSSQGGGFKLRLKQFWVPVLVLGIGVVLLILKFVIMSQIRSGAIDQVVLSSQNEGIWAHFPGDTHTDIYRNWTFFNFSNADDVLFYDHKPKFREIQGFSILEREDYLNITYSEGGDRVDMIDWLHFDPEPSSRSLDEKVRVLNVGALGYWYNLKMARPTLILQQGLALLFQSIENSIIPNIYAQGIKVQFLKDFQSVYNQLFAPAEISLDKAMRIWSDTVYGIQNQDHLHYWIEAMQSQQEIQQELWNARFIQLMNYFALNSAQMLQILQTFQGYMQFLESSVLDHAYFQNSTDRTGRYLAYRQMTDSFVTRNPPSGTGVEPTETICQSNVTCEGTFPEIDAYYRNVYLKRNPNRNQSLTFDYETVKGWLNYNFTVDRNDTFNKKQDCLFHIGNLDALWENGTMFDQSMREVQFQKGQGSGTFLELNKEAIPNRYLENIRRRFNLPTLQHSMVFWDWCKYITYEVVLQNMNNAELGVANVFSQGLYEGFSTLQQKLQNFLLSGMIYKELHSKQSDCIAFAIQNLELQEDKETAEHICDAYGDEITLGLVEDMLRICRNPYQVEWKNFKEVYVKGMDIKLVTLCDEEHQGSARDQYRFGSLLRQKKLALNRLYGCDTDPQAYCSDFRLAAIQWTTSSVTLNPPQELSGEDWLSPSYTFADWHSDAQRVEYGFFKSKYANQSEQHFPEISLENASKLLNFDNWYSAPVSLRMYKSKEFSEYFRRYMRYVGIEVGLNGLTMERSPRDLIFGYEDEILREVKEMYPPFGGDPSTPSVVAFNEPNITQEEASLALQWNTGKEDPDMLGQYRQINHLPYLTVEKEAFNGNETRSGLESPWVDEDYFYGTSAKQFAPNQFESKNISLYIPNLARYGSGSSEDTFETERYGFELMLAYLGDSIYQSTEESDLNKKYYQTFRAIFNETSVVGLPLFISKNHFMNATPNWSQLVDIYNEDESIHYVETSHWDDSFVIVEPYTGVSFQSIIYLQSNYYHQPDQLFHFYTDSLLPVFSIWRCGNLTESNVNDLFSPLKTGLTVHTWVLVLSILCMVVGCGLFGWFYYRKRKAVLQNPGESTNSDTVVVKKSHLGISMQRMQRDENGQQGEQNQSARRSLDQRSDSTT